VKIAFGPNTTIIREHSTPETTRLRPDSEKGVMPKCIYKPIDTVRIKWIQSEVLVIPEGLKNRRPGQYSCFLVTPSVYNTREIVGYRGQSFVSL